MTLEYSFELEDAIAFNRHYMMKSAYGRRFLQRALIGLFLLTFTMLSLPAISNGDWVHWMGIAAAAAVVVCGGYLLALPLLIRRTITGVHAGPASAQPFGPRRLVLERTGAREFSLRSETFATFASMYEPVETETHVFIQINQVQGFVVPKAKVEAGSLADFLPALRSALKAGSFLATRPEAAA